MQLREPELGLPGIPAAPLPQPQALVLIGERAGAWSAIALIASICCRSLYVPQDADDLWLLSAAWAAFTLAVLMGFLAALGRTAGLRTSRRYAWSGGGAAIFFALGLLGWTAFAILNNVPAPLPESDEPSDLQQTGSPAQETGAEAVARLA
ncbi:MAG: hypothetical protein JO317_08605 [Verrucomicrobiae bacterium]|nr:hypothetical protein [Verrucomicrobiae bacterium]